MATGVEPTILTASRMALHAHDGVAGAARPARRAAGPLGTPRRGARGVTLAQRLVLLVSLVAMIVQPSLAAAHATRAALADLAARDHALVSLAPSLQEAFDRKLWDMYAGSSEDDDELPPIMALGPRGCVLSALPASPAVNTQFVLSVSGCSPAATSYVWSGANVPNGTTTTASVLSVTAPASAGTYAYSVMARRGGIPSRPVSLSVNVISAPPPTFTSFDASPVAVNVGSGNLVPVTFTASNYTSVQYFYGNVAATVNNTHGSTRFLNPPSTEGVHQVRVRLINASGTVESARLAAVTQLPSPDSRSPAVGHADVGVIAGTFGVSDSGSAQYTIPIQVPPGTAGVQPVLSLTYNSHAGDGLLGIGWSLSGLSTIHRCPSTIAKDGRRDGINYDADLENDNFCLDGQRLRPIAVLEYFPANHPHAPGKPKRVEYRTELDSYSRIISYVDTPEVFRSPTRFQVWTKTGQVLGFGSRFQIRSLGWDQGQATGTPRVNTIKFWPLDRVEDRIGNTMEIHYAGRGTYDTGQAVMQPVGAPEAIGAYPWTETYPTKIRYFAAGTLTTGPYNQVTFSYRGRDPKSAIRSYDSGAGLSVITKALERIDTSIDGANDNPGTTVKVYKLEYQSEAASTTTARTRLQSVEECASAFGPCLPKTLFGWTDAPPTYVASTVPGPGDGSDRTKLLDMNGDGRTDFARITAAGANFAEVCLSQSSGTTASFSCSNWTLPGRTVPAQYDEVFADFNGDGRGDLVILDANGSGSFACYTNATGLGFASCRDATAIPARVGNNIRLWGDVDGNGEIDLLHYEGNGLWKICLSDGTNTAEAFACKGGLPGVLNASGNTVQNHVFVGDFNGDGRADLIGRRYEDSSTDQWKVCYSAFVGPNHPANGWSCPGAPYEWVQAAAGELDRLTVLDFNGDGLADMAARDPAQGTHSWRVCLSAGDGSFEYLTENWTPAFPPLEPRCRFWSGPDKDLPDVQFGDFNGDGRTDLAVHRSGGQWEIYRSTGTASGFWSTGLISVGLEPPSMAAVVAGDFNGDGRTDLAFHQGGASWRVALSSGAAGGDLLTTITTGLGAQTVVTYAPLTDATVYTKSPGVVPSPPELLIQSPLHVVKRTDATTAMPGTYYRTEYAYADLKGHSQGRGLLGFRQREVRENLTWTAATGTDATKQTRTVTTYDHGQPWPLAGTPVLTEKFAKRATGVEQKVSETAPTWGTYSNIPGSPGVVQLFQTQIVEKQWDVTGGQLQDRVTTFGNIDTYGNVGTIVVSGDSYVKTTVNTYGPASQDTSRWIIGRLTRSEVTNQVPGDPQPKKRVASFAYNVLDSGAGNCVKGLLCEEWIEPDEADVTVKVRTTHAYDAFGNRTSSTRTFFDGITSSRTTSTQYDPTGRFPTSATNAEGHVEHRRHDPRFGSLACQLSPAGIKVLTTYDAFGRRSAETTRSFATSSDCQAANDSSVGATDLAYQVTSWAWVNSGDKSQGYVATTRTSGSGETRTTFDNLQRETRRQVQAFDGAQYAQTEVAFDALGRKLWTRASSAGNGANQSVSVVAEYDGVNRIVRETTLKPDKSPLPGQWTSADVYTVSTIDYAVVSVADGYNQPTRLETTVTRRAEDVLKKQLTRRQTNSQGQVVRVVDAHGKASVFRYDHFGNLIQTIGPTNIAVTMSYDIRGRKKTLSDANVGATSWAYAYNGAGELVDQTDARGWTTHSAYDRLGRIVSRTENWTYAALATQWTYDACNAPKSLGKLCAVTGPGGWSRATAYDAYGRAFRTTTTIGGAAYTSHTLYDRNSRPRIVAYPASTATENPLNLRYEYNDDDGLTGAGAAWRVVDHFGGQVHWQVESATSATGRYLDGKFWKGSTGGTTTEKTYDELGRIRTIKAGAGVIQNSSYAFDSVGNFTQRADPAAGLTNETFDYDQLNRLIGVTTTPASAAAYARSYSYDEAGRIRTRPELPGACGGVPGGIDYVSGTHRVSCADGRSYQYDAVGNVTDDGVRTYEAYTPFNLPTRIRRGGTTLEYTYDGDHQRATERVVGTGTTTFVNGTWFEVATTEAGAVSAWRHYLDSPEGVIGVVTRYPAQAAATRYWHKDHLGSVVAETDVGGANVQRFAYDAWGKRRLATQLPGDPTNLALASSQRGFTGHEHLDEVGIVHMNGRLYNPVTGHFLQADPIIQEPLDAQNYNRYGYVLNNPLSYTDPSGFSFWKTWGRPLLAIVAAALMQVYLMPALLGSTFGLACTANGGVVLSAAGNAISSIGSGFAAGGIAGGNLESALQGALGASLFFAAGSIAQVAATTSEAAASAFAEGMPGRVALHATAGCASNAAAGGSCKHGAASAGFAQITGPYIHAESVAYNVAARAVAGGVGAALGGGKFQNGAVTAAFGYLFNCMAHECLAHYVAGSGTPLPAYFSELDAENVRPEQFQKIQVLLASQPPDGSYTISDEMGWTTKSTNAAATYGRVVLSLNGTLTVAKGSYTIEATLAARPDLYDFDKQRWGVRSIPGEMSTRVGSWLPGRPFYNYFNGSRELYSSGSMPRIP